MVDGVLMLHFAQELPNTEKPADGVGQNPHRGERRRVSQPLASVVAAAPAELCTSTRNCAAAEPPKPEVM